MNLKHGEAVLIERTGTVVVERLAVADRWWPRFLGLQFRATFPSGEGLLLTPCGSIHTCWMRFAINALFLSQEGVVLDIRDNLRPWRIAVPRVPNVVAVLEVPTSQTAAVIGDALILGSRRQDGPRRSIAELLR